eukprot:534391-Prymnesium_polylepis.1
MTTQYATCSKRRAVNEGLERGPRRAPRHCLAHALCCAEHRHMLLRATGTDSVTCADSCTVGFPSVRWRLQVTRTRASARMFVS